MVQWTNSWLIPSPRPGAIGSTSSKTSATAVWDLVESCCFGQPFSMICLFYSLCSPFSLVMTYIYIIYIHKHIHIYTYLYTPLFSHGGLVARRIMGYPVRAKRSFQNWGWKFTPEPLDLGLEAVFSILIFRMVNYQDRLISVDNSDLLIIHQPLKWIYPLDQPQKTVNFRVRSLQGAPSYKLLHYPSNYSDNHHPPNT